MVALPGGTFLYGETKEPRTVGPFFIDITEVTLAAYKACVAQGHCTKPQPAPSKQSTYEWDAPSQDNHPITNVDWNQAQAFCLWASKRLPTETEWEFAAKGSDERTYPWGNAEPNNQLCWRRSPATPLTCPVGSFPAGNNPFGLMDMAGNVDEWVSSSYDPQRVCRGGSAFDYAPDRVRATAASWYGPSVRKDHVGFRCAR